MKRALLVGLGTVAGTAAVLAYQPGSLLGTGVAAEAAAPMAASTTAQASQDQQPQSSAAPAEPAVPAEPKTYTGDTIDTMWGPVQVAVSVTDGRVTDVQALQAPNGDPRSARISARAIPRLQDQALQAQSSRIDGVSGASYTTQGFEQSLQSALVQAGLA